MSQDRRNARVTPLINAPRDIMMDIFGLKQLAQPSTHAMALRGRRNIRRRIIQLVLLDLRMAISVLVFIAGIVLTIPLAFSMGIEVRRVYGLQLMDRFQRYADLCVEIKADLRFLVEKLEIPWFQIQCLPLSNPRRTSHFGRTGRRYRTSFRPGLTFFIWRHRECYLAIVMVRQGMGRTR